MQGLDRITFDPKVMGGRAFAECESRSRWGSTCSWAE